MSVVKLEHHFATIAHETGLFEGVDTFPQLMEAVIKKAEAAFPPTAGDNRHEKFKGDAFEVFGEYLIKANPHDERIGITNYLPNQEKDMGVDGFGKGHDGLPAAVQFKFRQNVNEPLTYRDLSTFGNDALANYGIVTRGEAQRKNELVGGLIDDGLLSGEEAARRGFPFKDSMRNILVIATTLETYYTFGAVNRGSRFLGFKQLAHLTGRKPEFWNGFREALAKSAIRPKERQRRMLKAHQKEAIAQIEEFLSSETPRAQVIIPSGGGKTTVAHEAIDSTMRQGGRICIYISPRIALTMQNLHEIWGLKNSPWSPVCVCSGESEKMEYFENEEYKHVEPTTQDSSILHAARSSQKGNGVVFFVTNHSVLRIGRVLNELGLEADLVIGDEAHNLTAQNFSEALAPEQLPAKKWLFFTATRKVGFSSHGRGMNNEDKFGKIIYTTPPSRLVREGMIVPPRIHMAILREPLQIRDTENERELSIKDQLGLVVGGIRRHSELMAEHGSDCARVIVFCQSAHDAHDFAESETLREHLPEFYVEAITSKLGRMEGKNRKDIFAKFISSDKSILFHYDVISEGIDLPGATGILPLRPLGPIKATQGIGRALRLAPEDRRDLTRGSIVPGNPEGWMKPYGWVILPLVPNTNEDDFGRIKGVVQALRSEDYGTDVERMVVLDDPKGREISPPKFDPVTEPERHEFHDLFDVPSLLAKISHEIESEEQVRWRNFLDARDWSRNLGLTNWPAWRRLTEAGDIPWDIPTNPEEVYKNRGWRGAKDWLGF